MPDEPSTKARRRPRGTGCVYRRGETRRVKYYRSGRPFVESSGSKLKVEAERLVKRRQGEIVTVEWQRAIARGSSTI